MILALLVYPQAVSLGEKVPGMVYSQKVQDTGRVIGFCSNLRNLFEGSRDTRVSFNNASIVSYLILQIGEWSNRIQAVRCDLWGGELTMSSGKRGAESNPYQITHLFFLHSTTHPPPRANPLLRDSSSSLIVHEHSTRAVDTDGFTTSGLEQKPSIHYYRYCWCSDIPQKTSITEQKPMELFTIERHP